MLISVSYVYTDKFKILEHVLKYCLPSARTRVSSTRHCVSDALLTLQCKTFSRRCAKYLSDVK